MGVWWWVSQRSRIFVSCGKSRLHSSRLSGQKRKKKKFAPFKGKHVWLGVYSGGAAEWANGLQPAKILCLNFYGLLQICAEEHELFYSLQTTLTVSSFLLVAVKFVTKKGLKLEGKTWGTTSETVCATALKNTCFHTCFNSPFWLFPPSLSISATAVKPYQKLFWIRQCIYFHRGHREPPACLLDTEQIPGRPAKSSPISDFQKDAALSPVYYFRFLLEKVNLMSIIGS